MAADGLDETLMFDGRLRLFQPLRGHRVGTDAVLLAAAVDAPSGMIVDVGAGCGAVGLALALRAPGARVTLVEIDPAMAEVARRNVALNDFAARVTVAEADVLNAPSRSALSLANDSADLVVTNPPFFSAGAARSSPDAGRARAHVLAQGATLEAWVKACAALLKPKGKLVVIHRADALHELLAAMAARLGDIAILPVHPRAGEAAARVLVRGVKGSRAPLALRAGLTLHGEGGSFTPQAEALHRGVATLGL